MGLGLGLGLGSGEGKGEAALLGLLARAREAACRLEARTHAAQQLGGRDSHVEDTAQLQLPLVGRGRPDCPRQGPRV